MASSDPRRAAGFELALGATNYRELEEIDQASFLPFGKSVAFRKDAWAAVGGYPEWASHCEDLLFAMALKRAGMRFAFAPDALVRFRPRSSFRDFARQYFLYARGDGYRKPLATSPHHTLCHVRRARTATRQWRDGGHGCWACWGWASMPTRAPRCGACASARPRSPPASWSRQRRLSRPCG